MTCQHQNFECHASAGRLSRKEGGPITHYCADIVIKCAECGEKFDFIGLSLGMSAYRPTVSMDGTELRVPLMPHGMLPPEGLPGYSVRMGDTEQ
jgi:hypothetical protein